MAYTSGSPSAGQLEIGIALVLHDRFSNQAREASSAIRGLHRDAKNAIAANLNALQSYTNTISGWANTLVSNIGSTVAEGSMFIDTMTTVGAISQATGDELSELGDIAQTLGLKTMFMSKDIASGMQYLAMAGNDAKEIKDMISGAAMMANATGMELGGKGGTADLLTNIMRTFRLEGQQAANFVGNQLVKAAMSSNISMTDLAESIRYSAASMVTLKQQLPQVAAMIGTLGNAGIQGSMAGTSIRNMADYLTKSITSPNFKGYKALQGLGLSKSDFVDINGDLLDFAEILSKIDKASQGLSSTDKNEIFRTIFGTRGNRAAIAIMRDTEGYWDLLNKIQNESTGFTDEVVSKRMDTLAGKLDIVRSAAENLRTTFTESLGKNPIIRGGLDLIASGLSLLRNLFATPLGPWIAGLAVISAGVLKLGVGLVSLRTRWLILNGDSQVSFRSMIKLLLGGWSSATVSAQGYLNMERAILAQRKAGILGNAGGAMLGVGLPAGGVVRTANGRFRSVATGKFVSAAAAEAAANGAKPASLVKTLIGGAAGSAAAGAASRAAVGRGIMAVGGRLLGFLGGPVGLAITAISIFGPMIYRALTKNKDSQDTNTKSVNSLADTIKSSREGMKPKDTKRVQIEEMRWLVKMLGIYTEEIQKNNANPQNHVTHVVLNLDNKKAIEEYITDREAQLNVAAGVK